MTHGQNLQVNVSGDPSIEAFWGLPTWDIPELPGKVPNWTLRAGLQARRAVGHMQQEARLDALFFHTQITAVLCQKWLKRIPSVVSLDATPRQFNALGASTRTARGRAGWKPGNGVSITTAFWLRGTWSIEQEDGKLSDYTVAVPGGLPFTRGLVVFKTHAYTPTKDGNMNDYTFHTWQKRFIEKRWHLPPERVVFTPFMVDAHFFASDRVVATEKVAALARCGRPLICAVGLEFRDYPTLIEAVRGLDVHVVIAAASPWSKRSDTTAGQVIPENVTVSRFTQFELRHLYAISRFLVMPLYAVQFQAGVTAILEAMALEKAVICSRTEGQTDVVVEGETGIYVPPEDPFALRAAILQLLNDPEKAETMGKNGRRRIETEMSLECYAARLNTFVQSGQRIQARFW